jgi:uncharacterized membrane protein
MVHLTTLAAEGSNLGLDIAVLMFAVVAVIVTVFMFLAAQRRRDRRDRADG